MKRIIFLVLTSLFLTACSKGFNSSGKNPTIKPEDTTNTPEDTTTIPTKPTPKPVQDENSPTESLDDRNKKSDTTETLSPHLLMAYIKLIEELNPDGYVNYNILIEPLKKAKEIVNHPTPNTTQEDINASLDELRNLIHQLEDGSGFAKVLDLPKIDELPDPFTFINGTKVNTIENWIKRADEIKRLFEYYMYGPLPSGEKVTYSIDGNNLNVTVEVNGKEITFPASFSLPDKNKIPMPEGGYPVILAFGWLQQSKYANDKGYAVITLNTQIIAEDSSPYRGLFYDIHPYGDIWTEQTGVLVAWGWGISKIIDALEVGAGAELNISPEHTILTGVSRWGKATAVAGAFDKRIKVTAPSCSGAAGMAVFRYPTQGKIYNYSKIGASTSYVMGANEPLGSLQSSGERHWFNSTFLEFKDHNFLPFDQHLLASLIAEEGRHLFITASYLYEDWTNPPAMWLSYLAAKEVFDYLGLENNIAIHIHKEGHMVTDEDMEYLIDYCNYHFYQKESQKNLDDLKTSLFLDKINYDSIYNKYIN